MKKLYYLIVLALILGLVLTGCLLSNVGQVPTNEQSGIAYLTKATEQAPLVSNLIADGRDLAIDVGDVLVWNNGDTLYVKYVITDSDWCLTETHLHVFLDDDKYIDVPHKNGNPIPGKFSYQCCYDEDEGKWVLKIKNEGNEDANCDAADSNLTDPCLSTITYTIPLTWDLCTNLFIAAHAVVEKSWTDSITIVSNEGDTVYGPMDQYYQIGNPAWGASKLAVETWVHSAWPWKTDPDGAKWISTSYLIGQDGGSVPDSSWRWFHEEFVIPDNSEILSASFVMATADNAEEVYFNGTMVGSDGEVQGGYHDDQEWSTLISYIIDPVTGVNTLDFIVRNYPGINNPKSNPTGLIYKTTIDYEVTETETAWADDEDFPGKNWATYFNYIITGLPTISSEDLAGSFIKDELGYFDVTTVNPECGFAYSNVLFRYTIEGILEGDITVFEYYDEDTTTWYKAPKIQDGSNVIGFFGPPTGFPMDAPYDETTTFRINIGIVGTFPVTITLNDLVDVAVLVTLTEDVVVNPIP